jgi:anti-sigma factor, putative, ChrR family
MTMHSHPSDETLARYAAGTLAAGPALVVATHLEGCAACRRAVAGFTAAAAAMMEQLAPVPMSDDALALALARIERPEPRPVRTGPSLPSELVAGDIRIPLPAALATRAIGRWRWIGPGVRFSKVEVPEDPTSNVILLWVKPGTRLPEHGHGGTEFTQILHGSYFDGIARYRAGDMQEAGEDLEHQPVVDADGECICLAAVVGGMRPTGMIGALLRPFLPM